MKSTKVKLAALTLLAAGIFAFRSLQSGSIKGTVSPANGATAAIAISGMDTLKSAISDGAFNIEAPSGTYKVIISAIPPYKDYIKTDVTVAEGNSTDLGEIKLEQ